MKIFRDSKFLNLIFFILNVFRIPLSFYVQLKHPPLLNHFFFSQPSITRIKEHRKKNLCSTSRRIKKNSQVETRKKVLFCWMTMIYWTNTTFLLISVIVLLRSCVSFSFCSCDICSFFLSHRLLTFQLFLENSLCLVLHTILYYFTSFLCFFGPFFSFFSSPVLAYLLISSLGEFSTQNQMISMVLFSSLWPYMLGH